MIHYPTAIMSVVETRGPITLDALENLVYAKVNRDYPEFASRPLLRYYFRRDVAKALAKLIKNHQIEEKNGVYSPALSCYS